jgi:hypothetical protein
MTLHPIPLNFLIYEENFLFFFISVVGFGRSTLTCAPVLLGSLTYITVDILSDRLLVLKVKIHLPTGLVHLLFQLFFFLR